MKVHDNAANIHERVAKLTESTGAEAFAVRPAGRKRGPNFGSQFVQLMRKPEIAIAWDTPTGATSAGSLRFVLERQFGYPTTPIRTTNLATADLSRFNVLILPDSAGGGYGTCSTRGESII